MEITISAKAADFVACLLANELVKFGFEDDETDALVESVVAALRNAETIKIANE
jgi:hypothetical protein